jgi:hypothetical protein
MDPAPFRSRELDPAVIEYIIAFAEKSPSDADLGLAIRLETAPQGDVQAVVADAVGENFRRMAAATRRKLSRLFHDGRISLVIGVGFVALAIAIGEFVTAVMGPGQRGQVISDSFVIGAWVALWHPINIFLFEWWPLRREARLYDRLAAMNVRVSA